MKEFEEKYTIAVAVLTQIGAENRRHRDALREITKDLPGDVIEIVDRMFRAGEIVPLTEYIKTREATA